MIYPRWVESLSRADFLSSVGLYLTSDRLYLVRLRKDLLRVSVVDCQMREIVRDGDGGPGQHSLSEAIRSLLPHFNSDEDPIYVCLSPDQVAACQVFLPHAAEGNLEQVLGYEIERLVPFPRQEIYYDSVLSGKRGDKLALYLFAVRKKALDELLEVLSAFGLRPAAVEPTATALSSYLLFSNRGIRGPVMVLGSQGRTWETVGLDLELKGRSRSPAIVFNHRLPQEDWVQGPGRELFHSFMRRSPELFGWGPTGDFLRSMKGESAQVEDLLALGNERLVASGVALADSVYIPAVGTALRGLREACFPVNLLPGGAGKGKGRALLRFNAVLTALLLIALIAWGGSYPVRDEIRFRQLQRETNQLGPSVEALSQEEEKLNRVLEDISFLSKMGRRKGETLLVLDELSRIVPKNAYFSILRYREETIEVRGSAQNASNLVPILERSPLFKNVGFNAPSKRARDNRETFSLKAEIER